MNTPKERIERYAYLKAQRSVFESHWQECADNVLPRKNNIVNTTNIPGEKKDQNLYDSTAKYCNEQLAGGLAGLMTNPTTLWFGLTTGDTQLDDDDEVRAWLQESVQRMHSAINNTNFHTEAHEVYLDLGCIGTAPLAIDEDDDTMFRFRARLVSEVVVEENNKGIIDKVILKFSWNARQIAQEFGVDNLPDSIKKALESKTDEVFEIIHSTCPRDGAELDEYVKKTPKGYPWASYYDLVGEMICLKESGFEEFPWAIPRWSKITGEVYGRSPSMTALPDIKMVNAMMKTTIRAAQKAVDPPVMSPDDGFLSRVNVTPGANNVYRAGTTDRIEPIFKDQPRVDFGYQAVEDVRKRIREAFFYYLLQSQDGPQKTATEVMQRDDESKRILGPVVSRQNSEFLNPVITRVFGIMLRRKALPPIPQKLSGRRLDVHYTSTLAKAQRTAEGQKLLQGLSVVGPLIQMDPKVADNINMDGAFRFVARTYGWPNDAVNDKDKVEGIRQARDQAQQQMIKEQQQMQMADKIQKVVPAAAQLQQAQQGQDGGGQQ